VPMSLRALDADRAVAADEIAPDEADALAKHAAWHERRRALERQRRRSTPEGPRRAGGTPRPALAAFQLGLKLTGLWRRGVANGVDVRLQTLRLELPALPDAFHGYRVLHLADPHLDAAPGLAAAILESVAGLEVDLCVCTGDFRAADRGPFTETGILEPLAALRRSVRAADGFFATLGNHDCADMAAELAWLGYELLLNRSRRLRRGGAEILVTGVDDVHRFYTPAAAAALSELEPATFGLALVHSPEFADQAAAAGYGLYLCGHSHGGQVCLPGGRPLVTNLPRRQRHLASGLWRHRAMTGYTSPGAGLSSLPVRFNCPGEVTLFVLGRAPDDDSASTQARDAVEPRAGAELVRFGRRPGTF
jgi:predicted MPP superfamily phosphohydrolase